MVSAAEQLAKNANWGALAKATELKQRLLFVLGALLVYRLGTYGGILGMFNMFSGGALERMAIFALNIMPYISASSSCS
jgi:preprotein translocase subunit SecY